MTERDLAAESTEIAMVAPHLVSVLRGIAIAPLVVVDFSIIFELTSSYIEKRVPDINEIGVLVTAGLSSATGYCADRVEELAEPFARASDCPGFAPNTTIPSPIDQSGIA